MTTQTTDIVEIVKGIEQSTYDVETESRLARVGLKDGQDIASILEQYAWLYNLETVKAAENAYRAESDPAEKERLRRVYYYVLNGFIERQTAALDDRLTTYEMEATVEVDGETIPYHNVRAVAAQEPEYDRRDRLRDASLRVVEHTNPDRLELLRTRLDVLSTEFGYYEYTAYNSDSKRVDYSLLRANLEDFLVRTESVYLDHMGRWVERATGRKLGQIGSNHFVFMSRMPQYDEYFSKDRLLDVYDRTLRVLGIDISTQTNIHLDIEDRPKKNPRAVCYPSRPPSEVHLIIKPIGGLDDYSAFFHEAGHAQHYGNTDPSLPYLDRAIGTSYALTEIYSFLLQFLTVNPAWLTDMFEMPQAVAEEVVYYIKLTELFMLRRYVSKLQYELRFFEEPLNNERNQELYAGQLEAGTRFVYQPQGYLYDMDAGYYTADYLRAWITEAMLRHHLESTYGERWFNAPEAGKLLRDLWATGEQKENEDVATMLGYSPFDTSYLAAQYTSLRSPSER
ncbi:MAG: hypothetical protein WKH64_13295 [Chloroflexia bacterium]